MPFALKYYSITTYWAILKHLKLEPDNRGYGWTLVLAVICATAVAKDAGFHVQENLFNLFFIVFLLLAARHGVSSKSYKFARRRYGELALLSVPLLGLIGNVSGASPDQFMYLFLQTQYCLASVLFFSFLVTADNEDLPSLRFMYLRLNIWQRTLVVSLTIGLHVASPMISKWIALLILNMFQIPY